MPRSLFKGVKKIKLKDATGIDVGNGCVVIVYPGTAFAPVRIEVMPGVQGTNGYNLHLAENSAFFNLTAYKRRA